MRLQSVSVTNQRIKTICVANIFMLCLLTSKVWSFANIEHNRFARQLNDEMPVNYENFPTTNPYHQPHFTGNRSVVVQLFEWKFVDIAAECRDFLGPQGYAGVQLSPVLEHTVVKTGDFNHPWWERSEVVSYRLASRSGDEMEFWSMSRICNEHGVRIYVDVVLNHMAAPLHYLDVAEAETEDYNVNTLLETNVNLRQLNYSHVPYTHNDFHKPTCLVLANTQDAHVIRNCQLNGHPDLDHSRGNVQKRIVEMLNKFIDMGVAGFRVDTAKYMWPIDLKNIFKQVKNLSTEFNFQKNSRPFVYYDVFDLGLDAVSKTEYSTYGVVSEYLYAAQLSTILQGKVPLGSLINWGPALGFLSHEDALVFIDSHDTQRGMPWELGNNQMLTYKQPIEYIMANVFMLVHPYGAIKRIMSSYSFPNTDINQGPPVEEADEEEIRSPKYNGQNQCTKESGWVCEHRWPQMVNLVKVANYFRAAGNHEQSIIYFQTNGPNQVAFCRGQKAFVAINNDVENDFIKEVYGCLEPGMYCDMVTGGKKEGVEKCHGKILEIDEQGYIKLELNVADNKRGNNEEGIEAEDTEDDEGEEKADTGEIHSHGIVVIYVESKIKPADQNEGEDKSNETDGAQAGDQEEEKSKENEDKPSTEDEKVALGDATNSEQEQEKHDTDNEEPLKDQEQEVDEEGEEKSNEKLEESAQEEDVAEAKPDSEEKLETENQDSNNSQDMAEVKESSESNLSEGNEKQPQDGENDIEVKDENDDNKEIEEGEEEKEEDEEKEKEEKEENDEEGKEGDAVSEEKEKGEKEENDEDGKEGDAVSEEKENEEKKENDEDVQEDEVDDKEEKPTAKNLAEAEQLDQKTGGEDTTEEPEQDIGEESAGSSDSGNNQSRNLDEKNADVTEEQIEKPSAEIVDEAGDISDTVTAKIQDIQTAGIFSKPQADGTNG